jgi:hypothetical protein
MLPKINKQFVLMAAKLLGDALKLMLFSLILILIAEAVLPGIITARINITYVLILTMLFYFFQEKLTGQFGLSTELNKKAKKKNWVVPVAVLFFVLLIIRSLIKFNVWQIILITLGIAAVSFLIYKEAFSRQE